MRCWATERRLACTMATLLDSQLRGRAQPDPRSIVHDLMRGSDFGCVKGGYRTQTPINPCLRKVIIARRDVGRRVCARVMRNARENVHEGDAKKQRRIFGQIWWNAENGTGPELGKKTGQVQGQVQYRWARSV
jgi:hypothetical protein